MLKWLLLLLSYSSLAFALASSDTMSLKNAVVTGANRGIGLELCKQLVQDQRYQKIYALCRKTSETLTNLAVSDNKINIVDVNIMDEHVCEALQSIFRTNEEDPIPIHLLIHNAGAYGPPEDFPTSQDMYNSQTLENITPERMMYSFQLNTLAPLFVTQALLPNLKAKMEPENERKVIIITSLMGSIADNGSGGHYGYRTAKAGTNMVGKSLSADLKDDMVAVGLIHPGFVFTGFGDGVRREGQRDVEESVRGVLQAIEQVSMEATGCFLHGNYGEEVRPLNW